MTAGQRERAARAIVAAAARSDRLKTDQGDGRVPYSVIARAFGISRQRVKAMVEERRRDLAVKTGGDDFVAPAYRESFAAATRTRRKLPPVRNY